MSEFKYFHMDEFACSCCGKNEMSKAVVKMLDEARHIAGIPFVITSGYRCPINNLNVGGSPKSSHLRGLAADIQCLTSRARFVILDAVSQVRFDRIGIADSFIHVDDDPYKASRVIWTYGR